MKFGSIGQDGKYLKGENQLKPTATAAGPEDEKLNEGETNSEMNGEIYITIRDAVEYTGFPQFYWKKWILAGLVECMPPLPSDVMQAAAYDRRKTDSREVHHTGKGKSADHKGCRRIDPDLGSHMIPLRCLPEKAQENWYKDHYLRGSLVSIDLVQYRLKGEEVYQRAIRDILLVERAEWIRNVYRYDVTGKLNRFAKANGISISKLYRLEQKLIREGGKNLLDAPKPYKPRTLCPMSERIILRRATLPGKHSNAEIFRSLQKEAQEAGKDYCGRCSFNPAAKEYEKAVRVEPDLERCTRAGGGIIVPVADDAVGRYVRSLPEEVLAYGQKGERHFDAEYVHKCQRSRPTAVNGIWFADHHLLDILVFLRNKRGTGEPILCRPWITVIIDAASGAIIGCVVTIRPNANVIMQCITSAAEFTIHSPFFGLPEILYADRGKDYMAQILEGKDPLDGARLEEHYYLNDALYSEPLLVALGVKPRHAKGYAGRTKPVERVFRDLEWIYLRDKPGYLGNSPENRPFDFEKEKKRLLKKGKLWDMDKLARYVLEVMIPEYNNHVFDGKGRPDKNRLTPMQLYHSLPRADTKVPDDRTFAVLKSAKKRYSVYDNGIKYHGKFYYDKALEPYIVKRKDPSKMVMVCDFEEGFTAGKRITVVDPQGRYLCDAWANTTLDMDEKDRLKLMLHLAEQNEQRKRVSEVVRRSYRIPAIGGIRLDRYDEESYLEEMDKEIMYHEAVDEKRDQEEADVISRDLEEIGLHAEKNRDDLMQRGRQPQEAISMEDFMLGRLNKTGDSEQ